MKIYATPKFSDELNRLISLNNYKVTRNSKNVITFGKVTTGLFSRAYTFHIDFETKAVTAINLKERCSGYKDVTVALKTAELKLLILIEEELNQLLQTDTISPYKVEVN